MPSFKQSQAQILINALHDVDVVVGQENGNGNLRDPTQQQEGCINPLKAVALLVAEGR